MSSTGGNRNVLPKDLLELQLGQVDLLMAMYASDDAVSLDDASLNLLEQLRDLCESDVSVAPELSHSTISLLLALDLSDQDSSSPSSNSLQLDISVPVIQDPQNSNAEAPTEPPPAKVRVRQPSWMSKAEAASLTADIAPGEDVLTIIEHIKEAAALHLSTSRQPSQSSALPSEASKYADEPTVRVWFYFPSISTRSKRDDIINYGPVYGLTGFLLAGKPGILCLEGGSRAIDDYMRFIKTESWGDIPPQHKKVSERHREAGPCLKRAFTGMQEITDTVGERRGERANRNDMKAFEAWLVDNGLGDAFGKILI